MPFSGVDSPARAIPHVKVKQTAYQQARCLIMVALDFARIEKQAREPDATYFRDRAGRAKVGFGVEHGGWYPARRSSDPPVRYTNPGNRGSPWQPLEPNETNNPFQRGGRHVEDRFP